MVDLRWVQELKSTTPDGMPHTHKTYLEHLSAVHGILQTWKMSADVCAAGFFHSIYGTERHDRNVAPLSRRNIIRNLIGETAERLAYANCALVRSELDRRSNLSEPMTIRDRLAGGEITLTKPECSGLLAVHLADWLEQLPRCDDPECRKGAYRKIATCVGGRAKEDLRLAYAALRIS
jgi:hypothetical protein